MSSLQQKILLTTLVVAFDSNKSFSFARAQGPADVSAVPTLSLAEKAKVQNDDFYASKETLRRHLVSLEDLVSVLC